LSASLDLSSDMKNHQLVRVDMATVDETQCNTVQGTLRPFWLGTDL